MSRSGRLKEAARADCGTRQGVGCTGFDVGCSKRGSNDSGDLCDCRTLDTAWCDRRSAHAPVPGLLARGGGTVAEECTPVVLRCNARSQLR